ncbi:MAG: hypothetical protein A2Y82_01670 [Candidatus Buchananbacteria bacterium RBG_13_36_9]|uniref:Glycosyl transferase family 28 C-terminal domain-containing protein n=1 Tax=Candidatus Buchananbacteria bacterium RBG_13_36_9 TaxID=1797530 RepID=A0A1G1XMA5_9BACT|nr:MAG: hypothetical protein A2Y82_01670 [Candidatus Buchananbacteria bacterium RBG_13_36_9]
MKQKEKKFQKAWVVAVDMGYGHQRAADPLRSLACKGKVINANNYPGIPKSDRVIWNESREFYEWLSKFKKVPIIGELAWNIFDKFQTIPGFYPKRDLSQPNNQLRYFMRLIKNKQWGKDLINKLEQKPLPLITTFFVVAFMAEYYNYSQEIYCLATDTDISRTWVGISPAQSRINYFAPNYRVEQRLKLYGIRPEKIFLTGFPLPVENVGGEDLAVLKEDLGHRLYNLDPKRKYITYYKDTISEQLGKKNFPSKRHHHLTLTFAVGGAGAQRDLGVEIVKSLKRKLLKNQIHLNLVAGIRNEVSSFFKTNVKALGLGKCLGDNIKILFANNKEEYFKKFNRILKTTDILWTKPSELSFYTALGLPLIISQPIGSQEDFNRKWLLTIASGVEQEDVRYTDQWLFDYIDSGWFAEAAMEGYMEAPKFGTYNIQKIIEHKYGETKKMRTILQY